MRKNYYLEHGIVRDCLPDQANIIHLVNPTDEEKDWLVTVYHISPHTISSALDPDELGRLEYEDDVLTLIINTPKNYSSEDQFLFRVLSKGIILFPDLLLILTPHDEPTLPLIAPARKLINLTDVLLIQLAGTIGHFLAHLKVINLLSDSLEKKINDSMANKHLLSMFTIEKSLVYYLSGISSNHSVMEKLRNNAKRFKLTDRHADYLDDIIIDNSQCNKQAQIYSDILTGLMDARGSIVNNNLNLLIKRLTIISIVFMPPNIIAGIFGSSEYTNMFTGLPRGFSFFLYAVGLSIVSWLTYLIVRKFSGDASGDQELSNRRGHRFWIRNRKKMPSI